MSMRTHETAHVGAVRALRRASEVGARAGGAAVSANARAALILLACVGAFTIGLLAGELHGAERMRRAERETHAAVLAQLGTDLLITHEALKIAADPLTRAMAGAQAVTNVLERQQGKFNAVEGSAKSAVKR